jgi:hypothetical protein
MKISLNNKNVIQKFLPGCRSCAFLSKTIHGPVCLLVYCGNTSCGGIFENTELKEIFKL